MREREKGKRKKISRKSLAILVVIAITIPLLIVAVVPFSSYPVGDKTYISATDLIKNFRFATIGNEPIVDRGAYNDRLRFEAQESWIINRDTINPVDTRMVETEDGYAVYLRYKIETTNRINIFTKFKIDQATERFNPILQQFPAGHYKHHVFDTDDWFDKYDVKIEWDRDITWEHWDFGESVISHGARENVFDGVLITEFDIAPSPLPDIFGDDKSLGIYEWAYIVVDAAGTVHSEMGDMSKDEMPDVVTLNPSEHESDEQSSQSLEPIGNVRGGDVYEASLDPNPYFLGMTLKEQFAEDIQGASDGSSLNPKNLDGSNIWDPEETNRSMSGCRLEYDLYSLSPKVTTYFDTLCYTEIWLETQEYWDPWPETSIEERYFHENNWARDGDVALKVTNRYIQPEIRVIFDIWSKVEIGPLTEYYELMKLESPEEFYEELIWASIAGGWTGSYVRVTAPTGLMGWLYDQIEDFFDFFGGLDGLITTIILIGLLLIGGYVFLVVGVPMLKTRQKKKEMEEMYRSRR